MPFIPARLCLLQSPTGVGKSSLICTLISRHFSENGMPDVYANVSIPENAVWDNQVQVTIIDSSQLISNEEMTQKILEADSIVLVYDVERRETLEHLMTYWLPQCIVPLTRAPVIVAGNKVDSRSDFFDRGEGGGGGGGGGGGAAAEKDEYGSEQQLAAQGVQARLAAVAPLLEKFRENIWACYECSAKNQNGVIDVFYMAQHVVVSHPAQTQDGDTGD
jgi:GTPase SAR1 family protein